MITVKINAQDIKFSWSIGDFSIYYNFLDDCEGIDVNIAKFNVSFEKINLMLRTSFFFAPGKNDGIENVSFYNSFLPLELIYTPFQRESIGISMYGRGSWIINYSIYGAIGFSIGLFPIKYDNFNYFSHVFNIFLEYTTHNELKAGISIDFYDIIYLFILYTELTKRK
jgi:hypothetical protein